jgi:hypothetical protein
MMVTDMTVKALGRTSKVYRPHSAGPHQHLREFSAVVVFLASDAPPVTGATVA